MNNDKLWDGVKLGVGIVVTVGAGAIVGNAVRFTTPSGLGVLKRACIGLGSFVLGSVAGDVCVNYTNGFVDGLKFGATKTIEIITEDPEPVTEE